MGLFMIITSWREQSLIPTALMWWWNVLAQERELSANEGGGSQPSLPEICSVTLCRSTRLCALAVTPQNEE